MKRLKKMLSLLLIVSLLLESFIVPTTANAADAELTGYLEFLNSLSTLEEYAVDYSLENPGKDPAALTIKYICAGVEEFDSAFWDGILGREDAGFASYVEEREDSANAAAGSAGQSVEVTELRSLGVMTTPGGAVDMGRVFAVLDAYYCNDGENEFADVAGWAADLVDLMELAQANEVSGTVDEMVKEMAGTLFLQDGTGATFSYAELCGDLDGYAIAAELASAEYEGGTIAEMIRSYYVELTDEKRGEYFLDYRLDGVTARGDIRDAIFEGYTGNARVASLESSRNLETTALSDLRKACCYVLADYLCMLAGDYVDWNDNIYYSVLSSEKRTLVPGVTQEKYTAGTSDDKQIVYYLATADVSNPYVNVYMNYNNNDPSLGWGMQSVRDQAYAAEQRHSDPADPDLYIPNYNVVVAINGAGYNMTTGEPSGVLMMEGIEYQAPEGADHSGYGFFGILKDGSAVIGSTEEYYELKEQGLIREAIDVFSTTLVKDGQIVVGHSESHVNSRASRTAIGITRTGKVVVMTLDGRQEPVSCGGSFEEIAQIMLDAGCVDAINLDGGGSTTFLAQLPGDDDLSLINKPSDGGVERLVSSSLIIVCTMPDAALLDHAELSADTDYLTVGAEVSMQADGFNAVGREVDIPADARWGVSDSTVASISDDGVLTGRKNGTVEVSLTVGGKTVGTKTMYVVVPDALYFEEDSMSVMRGESADLPVVALYENKRVAFGASDLVFSVSNQGGTISGLRFTAGTDASVKGVVVTATAVKNPDATASAIVLLYDEGDVVFDFAESTGGDRRLAWLRDVVNATTGDNLIYFAEDESKSVAIDYTLAFDLADIALASDLRQVILEAYGVTENRKEDLFLRLADKISAGENSVVTVKIALDEKLTVDVSELALTSELFSLDSAVLDQTTNTLVLTLCWEEQSAPLSKETTNTVCILSGISVKPITQAGQEAGKRLEVENAISMEYSFAFVSDQLFDYASTASSQGIESLEGEKKGAIVKGTYVAGKDSCTLVNSVKSGWIYEEGGYAYYVSGVRYTGVKSVDGVYYDFGESGINIGQTKYTGLFMDDGVRCCVKEGVLTSGWYTVGDAHYYFDENGKGYNGTVKVDGIDIEFDNGLHIGGYTGFVKKDDGRTYHYTDGKMDFGWLYIGDDLYHFNTENGVMTTGTHVIPDDEARAKGAYYDFTSDGRTLWGYFNGFGYYYWAGAARKDAWVKNGADPDRDAWYRTNANGHYVTDGTGKETFNLEIDGVTYKAVKIACDGVVYTFDTTNGKLLEGSFVLEDGKWYYYWAGSPVNDGWFDFHGNTYYAYEDGHLATGSHTIDGETYVFDSFGAQIKEGLMMSAALTAGNKQMIIKISDADEALTAVRVAIWSREAGQETTLKWFDAEKNEEGQWVLTVTVCPFGVEGFNTYELHAYGTAESDKFLVATTVEVPEAPEHTYTDDQDTTCDFCGAEREVNVEPDDTEKPDDTKEPEPKPEPTVPMFRLYNPNSGEHFYTGSEEERDNLVAVGWNYEGIAWNAPIYSGAPVYRVFNPNSGDHHYTMSWVEVGNLVAVGWIYEGVAWNSASADDVPQYRLYNPNAPLGLGSHHYTSSVEERDYLVSLGWIYEGIGWFGKLK